MKLEELIQHCERLRAAVESGDHHALDAYAELKAIEGAANEARKAVEPLALEEALKHPKTFEHGNLTFTRTEGRRLFNYSHIREWVDQNAKVKAIEEAAKNAALQAEKGLHAVTEDGEVMEAALITYGKASLSVK